MFERHGRRVMAEDGRANAPHLARPSSIPSLARKRVGPMVELANLREELRVLEERVKALEERRP